MGMTQRTKDGWTALMFAANAGNTDVVTLILKKGVDLDAGASDGWTALMFVVADRQMEMVEFLVNKGANINIKDNSKYAFTALVFAVEAEDYDIAEFLLVEMDKDDKADSALVAYQKGQALLMAAKKEYSDIVRLMLRFGADVNTINRDGYTSLMYATMFGFGNIVGILIENKADPNIKHFFQSKTALDYAREKKFKEIERMLLQVGAKEGWEVY